MQFVLKYIWAFVAYYNIFWGINKDFRTGKSSLYFFRSNFQREKLGLVGAIAQ